MRDIYVILIDGQPHTRDSAIRTYKSRENAEKYAKVFVDWALKYDAWRGRKIEVARFEAVERAEVSA